MIFLSLLLLLVFAAYNNQTTYINYLLIVCALLGTISIIYTIISSFFVNIDAEIDKEICYKNGEKKIVFTSSSFLHPRIVTKAVLVNKQLHKKMGSYYIDVKTDGCIFSFPAEECGDIEVIFNSYYLKGFFGLFQIRKSFKRKYVFKVYPKPSEFNKEDIKELVLSGDGEPINKRGGDFQELFEIRPIQPGDNLRYIHPSLSAKFGEYMIKVGSDTQRRLLLYSIKNTDDFSDVVLELRKISAIYNEVCKDQNNYFCVEFNYNWYIVLNDRSLFGLFDLVYKEYIK